MNEEKTFYKNAAKYWATIPPTIDGILGGFGQISNTDIEGSQKLLSKILSQERAPGTSLALDCGAGIGRVSQNLLTHFFQKVDLVEQDEKFAVTAQKLIGKDNDRLGTVYKLGLQHFKPGKKYDVIWCQWVIGHLTDFDLISFLSRCGRALKENGVIIVKENITSSDAIEYDEEDSSVTRPIKLMEKIFSEAHLRVLRTEVQVGFPEEIYDVHMFALAPKSKVIIV